MHQSIKAITGALSILTGALAVDAQKTGSAITVYYEDHPPFVYREDGSVKGTFAAVAQQAADQQGFEIKWLVRAFKRSARELRDGTGRFCSLGHRMPETPQSNLWYSPPMGTFGRTGLLVREADRAAFEKLSSFRDVFEHTSFIGGFVESARYAVPHMDYIGLSDTKHVFIAGDHEQLATLVARKRIDFTIENDLMMPIHEKMVAGGEVLAFVSYPEMPAGLAAHAVCTLAVPQELRDRFGAGIQQVTQDRTEKAAQ